MPRKRLPTPETATGWLFCLPWIIGFLALFVWPLIASAWWSFCHYDMVNPPHWIGGDNYGRLLSDLVSQQGFGQALTNSLYYSLLSVPFSVILGVLLAVLLSAPLRGQAIYRTLVFLPSVIPVVAASILWLWLLNPESGMVNYLLSWIGVPPQNWLNQARPAISLETIEMIRQDGLNSSFKLFGSKDALVLMSLWGVGNFVVIYLAAISDIPRSLYEAAEMDGASPLRKLMHVTLPMLSPVIFFNLVMGLIRSVQTFTSIYVMSEGTGAPAGSLKLISLELFLAAFSDLEMGYASAMALLLFIGLALATLLLFRTSRYWVHYRMVA